MVKGSSVIAFLAVAFILIAVPDASGQNIRWNSDGTQTLTQAGWTLAGTVGDGLTKSLDFSSGQADSGTDGVWRITDNNVPYSAYMRMYKDPGGLSGNQGIVMARVKFISANDIGRGTFGYSSAAANTSTVLSVRDNQINWKTAEGGDMDPEPVGGMDTHVYRVYALRWYADGTFDVWYSNTSDWSPNQSDWTQAVSRGAARSGQSALIDQTGAPRTGLLMGAFNSSSYTWDGCVDYIAWSGNTGELEPWNFNPLPTQPDDSQYISDTIPAAMEPSQVLGVSITLRNMGTNTWTAAAGYKLGAVDDSDPFCAFNRVDLDGGDSIAQFQQKTFNFSMTAPATPGIYTSDWRMIHEGVGWFGYTVTKQVSVTWPDSAQYISDTIPSTMQGGQQYNVSVTMKNTSQNTWTQAASYRLGAVDDSDPFAGTRVDLAPSDSIGPNQEKTFSFSMTAPLMAGIYTTDWRMLRENLWWFGDTWTEFVDVSGAAGGLLLDDPLQGSTSGARDGGTFVSGGWQVSGDYDSIYWHLPYTVSHGAAEFYLTGINTSYPHKTEHFHMYDYTFGGADTVYSPGYRDNPYKHFVRKTGTDDPGRNGSCEIVYAITPNYFELDTANLSWVTGANYKMRVEWGPEGGNSRLNVFRDGVNILSNTLPGTYAPMGHSVRIGCSPRRSNEGSEVGAKYSYVKVWDMDSYAPAPPIVTTPANGATNKSGLVYIAWTGDTHTNYQVRVCTSDNPNVGVAWDSGDVASGRNFAWTGNLADLTNYYVYVKIRNAGIWSGWSASGRWFRVDSGYAASNNVKVSGRSYEDANGPFLGLGFTFMASMWMCKNDRTGWRNELAYMSSRGFNYQRILSEVPGACSSCYWWGRAINAGNYTCSHGVAATAWSDYDQQLRDCIDIAYDTYGIRTEITIFGGAGEAFPTYAGRQNHCQRVLNNLPGREHKILLIEVANEGWQTGFGGSQGIADLRSLGQYLADRTSIPIALTAMCTGEGDMSSLVSLYAGSAADVTTEHFSRNLGGSEGHWYPVRDSWRVVDYAGLPPASSNEPVGPGSSVASEDCPIHLVSAAAFAYIANLHSYVWHSRAGVRHDYPFGNYAAVGQMQYPKQILPPDVSSWIRNDGKESSAPFTAYCNGQANKYWTDVPGATGGCHRNIGGRKGGEFVCYPQGILSGGLTLQAREPVTFTIYNPLTGDVVLEGTKDIGQQLYLPQGPEAYIIKGTAGMADVVAPGPPSNFTATNNGTVNSLYWTNPSDGDFVGTMIRYRTDAYPNDQNDGTLVCNRLAPPGSQDSFVHSGVSSTVTYFYKAFAYDEIPNYSIAALASTGCGSLPDWLNEVFDTYPNGNLGDAGGACASWNKVGAADAQIISSGLPQDRTGKCVLMDTVPPPSSGIADRISFSNKTSGLSTMTFDLAIDGASGTAGQIMGYVLIYGSTSSTELARIHIAKSRALLEHASGTAILSSSVANNTWGTIKLEFDVVARTVKGYFNGSPKGTYNWKGTATNISYIVISSDRNTSLSTQKVWIDNLKLEPTPPQVAEVRDDGAYSPSLSKLHFAFDPVLGSGGYQYCIGTSSGGSQVRGWTVTEATNVLATGLTLAENTNYYISVQCANLYGTWGASRTSNGIKVAYGVADIPTAEALPDGQSFEAKALRGKVVTLPGAGWFYIQEQGKPFGLKVVSTTSVSAGNDVDVAGPMKGAGAERYLDATGNGVIVNGSALMPGASIVGNKALGGGQANAYTPGVVNGLGANNIGSYITVHGKVTQRDPSGQYFYIDDGAGLKDGTLTDAEENVGVRVIADPSIYPSGSYIAVGGVSSCFNSGGLRPRVLPASISLLREP